MQYRVDDLELAMEKMPKQRRDGMPE